MPGSKSNAQLPLPYSHRRDEIAAPREESHHSSQSVVHRRELRPTSEARSRVTKTRQTHPKYSGFHPRPAHPRNTPSRSQLTKDISEQLQANIQDTAQQFSDQIVHTANELVNTAADSVQADISSAAGAIGEAVQSSSANVEVNVENTVSDIGRDVEFQVHKYLNAENIERAAIKIVHDLAHAAVGASHALMPASHDGRETQGDDEEDPLLPNRKRSKTKNYINPHAWIYPDSAKHVIHTTRARVRHWLCSKAGHYFVLSLVALDVAAIVAAFIISLFKCEKRWGNKGWKEALTALDITSLVFSSLFMLELLASIWAFGLSYFRSKFHVVDAIVVIAGFTMDIALHGDIEEAASLIVVLRLWRVFKIIEELSLGAQEQVEEMEAEIEKLRAENIKVKRESQGIKASLTGVKEELDKTKKELAEAKEKRKDLEAEIVEDEEELDQVEDLLETVGGESFNAVREPYDDPEAREEDRGESGSGSNMERDVTEEDNPEATSPETFIQAARRATTRFLPHLSKVIPTGDQGTEEITDTAEDRRESQGEEDYYEREGFDEDAEQLGENADEAGANVGEAGDDDDDVE